MNNNQAMKEFLREKISIDVITKYIFIKSMEEKYDDEYLDRMYRINCRNIREKYSVIPEEDRTRIEDNIRKQIAVGEIDLSVEAANWHREGLRKYQDERRLEDCSIKANEVKRSKREGEER